MQEFDVDIRPDISALKMFRSLSFTPWYAIGEFVDNSISSYLRNRKLLEERTRGYQLVIQVYIDERSGSLVIEDNAAGIDQDEIPRALRTGNPPEDRDFLNLHGVGMKAAAFWWGECLKIETWPVGAATGWSLTIDLRDYDGGDNHPVHVRALPPRSMPGTRITIGQLWQDLPQSAKTRRAIGNYLPAIYRRFFGEYADGMPIRIVYEGKDLSFEPPALLEEPFWPSPDGPDNDPPVLWKRDVVIQLSSGKQVTGWIGILETMSRELSGFVLHYRGKGVGGVTPVGERDQAAGFRPRRIFGQSGGYRAQSYIGEFDVSAFGKSITTDSTLWSQEEEDEFVDRVLEVLQDPEMNFWAMAVNFKRRKKDQQDAARLLAATAHEANSMANEAAGRASHERDTDDAPTTLTAPTSDEVSFTIVDKEVHEHEFILRFICDDRFGPFLSLLEDQHGRHHIIGVNENHAAFDGLPPMNVAMRTLLTRFALAFGAAEVLTDLRDKEAIRAKFNNHLTYFSKESLADEPVS